MRFRDLAEEYMRERFRADEAKRARQKENWKIFKSDRLENGFSAESENRHKQFHRHSRKAANFKRRAYAMLRGGAA